MTAVTSVTTATPTVGTTSASSSSTSSSSTSTSSTVDYNSFLQLMIAELQNQDPTSPQDPTQYLSQIASFSQVEQQTNTNNKLDAMLTANSLGQADGVIGYTVTSADGKTSGTVSSVTMGSGGTLTATLSNGGTLALGSGVVVSAQ